MSSNPSLFVLVIPAVLAVLSLGPAACRPSSVAPGEPAERTSESLPLPTGAWLDPAGPSFDVGNMPLAVAVAPGTPGRLVLLLSGYREQGLQVVDAAAGRVLQTLPQPGAFLGLAFAPDGQTLYASGGDDDSIFRYDWRDGAATLRDRIELEKKEPKARGRRFPAGLALSPDGKRLYVAENLSDTLAVVAPASGRVLQRLPAGNLPYGVAVAPDGTVWVSAWGGDSVAAFSPDTAGLKASGTVVTGRHPSALLLGAGGRRLFVASATTDRIAVVDTAARRVIAALQDPPPSGPDEGSTPNALALSEDGTRLYVAEGDANAVAVFDLSAQTSGVAGARGRDLLAGRAPSRWYPAGLVRVGGARDGETLYVVDGKGRGPRPNPAGAQPGTPLDPLQYTLGQLNGTVTTLRTGWSGAELADLTRRVERANGWDRPRGERRYPPFRHVVYILKENRTYDQVFGDQPGGDGDPSLQFFPREVAPNHRALVERFGLFDRFFVNAEVSSQGHIWSTAAYVTDYGEKTVPSLYAGTREDPNEKENHEAEEPAGGFLWHLAREKGITFRNFGEATEPEKGPDGTVRYVPVVASLRPYTDPDYPGFDPQIPDERRAGVWLDRLKEWERTGDMPALQLLWLPNDHTAGARPGLPTPRAYMADNDRSLGRIVEALSKSRFWKDTVVFVLEDDAQSGPDHVDSHRSVLLVISPYSRPGTVHRFVNTTDVLATIEGILRLRSLSHFDHFGRPLASVFAAEPDLRPYQALEPSVPWTELNPPAGPGSMASARLDLDEVDTGEDDLFNLALWQALKGDAPYPGAKNATLLDLERGK
ncbi:MAG TPA: SMP-30/gluconolactonase/LRE family protein [Thermoanaerobaculia bacterium]|nr:SMP-30/gluconolactonase/LRE family protein [Thermoanaerobaculia bacterium]